MRKFSARSLKALSGVHPDLIAVARLALVKSGVDFTVVEGVRDLETQRKYCEKGVSKTMKSRHLVQPDGFGYAVDIYPYYDGSVQCEAPEAHFKDIAEAMQSAADELGVNITWGGCWQGFCDMPHYQLEK